MVSWCFFLFLLSLFVSLLPKSTSSSAFLGYTINNTGGKKPTMKSKEIKADLFVVCSVGFFHFSLHDCHSTWSSDRKPRRKNGIITMNILEIKTFLLALWRGQMSYTWDRLSMEKKWNRNSTFSLAILLWLLDKQWFSQIPINRPLPWDQLSALLGKELQLSRHSWKMALFSSGIFKNFSKPSK